MTRGPYLQHADSGIAVTWYTELPGEGRVRWVTEEGASGEVVATAGTQRYEAVLSALVPGRRYTYRVYSSQGLLASRSGVYEFSLRAPEPEALRIVLFGDCGSASAAQYAVARAIRNEALMPDFVMILGDVIYPPFDADSYDRKFFAPYAALLPEVPFYALLGNHDYEFQATQPFIEVFTLPRNGPAGLAPETSYWLERAGVQMIVHDTNQPVATLRQQAVPWQTTLVRRPAMFRFVFEHQTLYSSGPGAAVSPAPELRALLAPLYTETGIDVVFNGHDHLYERTREIGGVIYVTSGAGGAELYARASTNAFTKAFVNDRHSYTYLEVRGRTLQLRQMDTEGKTIDSLTLTKAVAFTDPLQAFDGAGRPPSDWTLPGFDASSWPEALGARGPRTLNARREFVLSRPGEVSEVLLRVEGASTYRVLLNDVEVARGGLPEDGPAAFAVPKALVRAGRNALALEGFSEATSDARPALELSLVSSSSPMATSRRPGS
jgi:predicted phosphodiesterase